MKIPFKWLQEYIDITLSPTDLAHRLTMAGSEVKGIQVIGGNWENITIGQIIAINPHPNADQLSLPTINLGTEQQVVICGAPNLRLGDKIAFAHIGAQLIDGHSGQTFCLKTAKIRGTVSNGMICSEKELGISDSHEGIMVLPIEASVGTPLADYLGDVILDLDVTPNRPDCLSIIGIARETVALTGQTLSLPEASYEETASPIDQQISVEITAPDLCPRYCASLISGVKIAESPRWLQQRLLACGMRPISNIVDITNYVMLEYGQPLHAFDYDKIRGKKIIVRRATLGKAVISLDGVERTLSEDMLVIADEEGTVAIAGVMGGANSEVTQETTSILLEAANFNPASIHYTGRQLQLPSEACMRFERGIRPELTLPALKRATQLITQLASGEAANGLVDVYPGKQDHKPILLSTDKVKTLLGVAFSLDQIIGALTSLGFDCKQGDSTSEVWATAPYWRSDIHLAVDLVEEVARIIGYDKIPTTMLSQPLPRQNPEPILTLKQNVGRILTGHGFQEVITYSLTSLEILNKLLPEPHPLKPMPLRMANPMTAEREYLRPNLRANLLPAFAANRRHEDSGIRLFELGKVYLPRHNDLPDEPEMLCGILGGSKFEKSWQGNNELFDLYDTKGIVEGLLNQIGVNANFEEGRDEGLCLGKQVAILVDDNKVGVVGELHSKVLEAFEISESVYLFEFNLTALLPHTIGHKMFQPIPRFPAIIRDMALIVDTTITHQRVLDIIKSFPLIAQIILFDVYSGDQVPRGKKSLAYRVAFQSPTHTLADKEVNKIQQQILNKLSQELGTTLRS
ncbi:phenylalanine--tRNA ligase subunit beta [Chloroflexota bacterium]